MTFSEFLTAQAREYLQECLKQTGGNVQSASKVAGVHRSTFYNLCDKCGVVIQRDSRPPRGHKSLSVWLGSKSENP